MSLPALNISANPQAAAKLRNLALGLALVGLVLTAAGFASDKARASSGWLLGYSFIWVITLGCLFLVALHHVTHAVWSVVFRRVAELFAINVIPVVLVAFLPVLLLLGTVYHQWANPAAIEPGTVLAAKTPYLNAPFFIARWLVYLLIWGGAAWFFIGGSFRQDRGEGGELLTRKMRIVAAPFMLLFALSATFAAFDWLMSLEPLWFSTIFGVYIFAGMVLCGLAVITLMTIWLKRGGYLGNLNVTPDHFYSLGALMFAFTCFWGYVAMSQLLLYWYANLPEETFFYVKRWEGGWKYSSLLLMGRWAVPFLCLLSRYAKTNETRLIQLSLLILFFELVDLHWIIMPALGAGGAVLSWIDFGPPLLLTGALLLLVAHLMTKHPLAAVGDPLMEKSRLFHL